jgi:hypothetical protein
MDPPALKNRPELVKRWKYAKEVFSDLSGSRRYTANGPANIPISEYSHYATGYGIKGEYWQTLWEDVQTIDSVWLSEVRKIQQPAK